MNSLNQNLTQNGALSQLKSSLPQNGTSKSTLSEEKAWKAAQDFESMFTNEMFKSMRKTIPQNTEYLKDSGNARQTFSDMLDQKYSEQIAATRSLGLAEKLYKEMTGKEAPASTTRVVPKNIPEWRKDHLGLPHWEENSTKATNTAKNDIPSKISRYDHWIQQAANTYNVDSDLIKSVIHQESGGDPKAVSRAGAKGLMQLTPIAAKDVGAKKLLDPKENIMGGVAYLKKMLDRYHGNEKLALAAYNAGPGNVAKYKGVPPFEETQNYIKEVLARKNEIKESREV